jgi:hypothetical protein
MLCLNPQKDRKNKAVVNTKYEKNKPEEAVSLEKDESKYINNIPQEFLIPRLSFKTDQTLSYCTQDIIDLIWKKYAKRHYKTFQDIQNYFTKIYQGKERHLDITVNANIFPYFILMINLLSSLIKNS